MAAVGKRGTLSLGRLPKNRFLVFFNCYKYIHEKFRKNSLFLASLILTGMN